MQRPTAKTGNPFNFRAPVRHLRLLAGREDELQQIDEFLRDAALGRPSHFSLFGPPGMGKSSLLNGAAEIAAQRRLLPISIELREATVESTLSFYGEIFNSALEALIQLGALDRRGPLMGSWTGQTLGGQTGIDLGTQPLEIGVMLSAKLNGKMVGEIPTAVLQRDLDTVLSMAGSDIRGIVLCLDGAEVLDDNKDLAPSLMDLSNMFPSLSLVTAAGQAGQLQATAPRAWSQIEIGPFQNAWAVFSAITLPLTEAKELSLTPKISTAREIFSLTEGQPYEVNLVSHFIWESISRGEQSDFALSETVLEQVLHEFEEKGRHESSPTISRIRRLTSQDLELAGDFAPYEGLTTRQLALLRLMLEPYDEDRLTEAEAGVKADLHRLATLGVVSLHGDRFELVGGPDTRLYLRYALERRVEKQIGYADTYARRATAICRHLISDRLFGSDSLDNLLMGRWYRREVVDAGAGGDWLRHIAGAVETENLSALVEVFPEFTDTDVLATFSENGGILFGFVLQVGLQSVEYVDIGINLGGLSQEEAGERVKGWLLEHQELLAQYEISVDEWCVAVISPHLGKSAVAYTELWRHSHWSYYVFKAGAVDDARRGLQDAIVRAEALIGDEPTDPLLRAKLADVWNRIGFIQAADGEFAKAQVTLELSVKLAVSEEWLTHFNLAYVRASQNELAAAAEEATLALEHLKAVDGEVVLNSWFPAPGEWSPSIPMSAVVVIPGGWVERFVKLQSDVIAAAADENMIPALTEALNDVRMSSPPGLLRLAAWAELTLLERADRAIELFDRAVHSTDLSDVDAVNAEMSFVNELKNGGESSARSSNETASDAAA